jgi:small subunit ribosomal protein S8
MDNVGDLIIRVKNAYLARLKSVTLSYSKVNLAIAKLLEAQGYLKDVKEVEGKKSFKMIEATLIYKGRNPMLTDVKRISKPGLRVYKACADLPRVLNGLGFAIVSTPKGIMSDHEARKARLGGEVMAYIW